MVPFVVALHTVSAILLLWGVLRFAIGARRVLKEEAARASAPQGQSNGLIVVDRGGKREQFTVGDLTRAAQSASPIRTWERARWDLALVGGGVLVGAGANIWGTLL